MREIVARIGHSSIAWLGSEVVAVESTHGSVDDHNFRAAPRFTADRNNWRFAADQLIRISSHAAGQFWVCANHFIDATVVKRQPRACRWAGWAMPIRIVIGIVGRIVYRAPLRIGRALIEATVIDMDWPMNV